ncbi:hypothetical protein [Poriferisphaera sp. WC338]|uniref:hypothetical protein n=1 Tax=Poriferisphaera sp. WC338 TaxID=3425129 RepID=UPI003D81B82A
MFQKAWTLAITFPFAIATTQFAFAESVTVTATGNASNISLNYGVLNDYGLALGDEVTFQLTYDLDNITSTNLSGSLFTGHGAITSFTATLGGEVYEIVDNTNVSTNSNVSNNFIRTGNDVSFLGDVWRAVYDTPFEEGTGNPTRFQFNLGYDNDTFDLAEGFDIPTLNGDEPFLATAAISAGALVSAQATDQIVFSINSITATPTPSPTPSVPTPSAAAMGILAMLPFVMRRRETR